MERLLLPTKNTRMKAFRKMPLNRRGFHLLEVSQSIQAEILKKLSTKDIVKMFHYLDPDEVTALLQVLSRRKRNGILDKLKKNIREKVEFLLTFNPKTAAGIMSLDYIEINAKTSHTKLLKIVKKHEKRTGKIPTILLVEDGYLIGEIPIYALGMCKSREKIAKYAKKVPAIRFDKEKEEIINIFKTHPHNKIVVLDDDDSILGVIYSDDILKLMEEQSSQSLYDFTGVSKEESALDAPFAKVKNRYRWLILNLVTVFFAASVIGLFQDTISKYVLLAAYMPVIAGMGGTAGSQTMAVMIRGIALKEISLNTARHAILNEVISGFINGAITGILAAVVAILWNQNPILGVIIAIAMIANLIIAGLFGAILPLILKQFGKDPASSATVFITTATDVCGFFIFLGLASLVF